VRVRVVLGVALALAATAVVVTLSQHGARLAGTDFVPRNGFTVGISAGAQACQTSLVPDDAAIASLLVSTRRRPRPPLVLRIEDLKGGPLATGRIGAGAQGQVLLPLTRTIRDEQFTRTCVRNAGARGASKVLLAGDIARPDTAARVDGRLTGGIVSVRYVRPGHPSWWAMLPVVSTRFGLGKSSLFGGWTLAAAAAVLLALWVAVARLLLRERR
jgi:hypothetical protein